jgi:hypothetical protein
MNKRTIFPCDCHAFHFLTFEWWPDDKNSDVCAYVAVGGADWDSWRKRIRMAWHCLRGGEPVSEFEVVLKHENVVELRNSLNEYITATSRLNTDDDYLENYSVSATVCLTHMRFIPCRTDNGCKFSTEQEDIRAVTAYQKGGEG